MSPPFETGDQVTVVASPDVMARATVLDCKVVESDESDEEVWEVTVLVKQTGQVHTLIFRYGTQAED